MRRLLSLALCILTLCLTARAVADEPLAFGVFPNLSARAIVTLYQPVQAYLEKTLHQRVQIQSAPDFRTFVERTLNREYDLVVIAPHLARLVQQEGGLIPLFGYSQELHAMVVVAKSSNIHTLEDLRGKAVALPDRMAVMPVLGLRLLREHGLQADVDYRLMPAMSHSNAAFAVQRGEAQGAIIGSAPFAQLPEELRDSLRAIATSESISNQFILASPSLSATRIAALKQALLDFAAAPEGQRFFASSGLGGLKPVTDADLKKMAPYARDVQAMLNVSTVAKQKR